MNRRNSPSASMHNKAMQYSSVTHWLSVFLWVWLGMPTSTSLARTPPAQPAIKGHGTKHRGLPKSQCGYISHRDLKPVGSPKSQHQFQIGAASLKVTVTIQLNKIFFHKFNASMSVFGNFENTCCMVYCAGRGANRLSKEGKCITVSFQLHFPMGSIQGKGWN